MIKKNNGRDFLDLDQAPPEEIKSIIALAHNLKKIRAPTFRCRTKRWR